MNPELAYTQSEYDAVVAERDHLRWVIDQIAESTMVKVVVLKDAREVTWGCGICEGEYQGRDDPKTQRGIYAHKDWCPRK